jgi:hypothetical protein
MDKHEMAPKPSRVAALQSESNLAKPKEPESTELPIILPPPPFIRKMKSPENSESSALSRKLYISSQHSVDTLDEILYKADSDKHEISSIISE